MVKGYPYVTTILYNILMYFVNIDKKPQRPIAVIIKSLKE